MFSKILERKMLGPMHSLCTVLALLAVSAAAHAGEPFVLSGKVVGVVDGDTLDLLTVSKEVSRIRLTGIDAPERAQAFGQKSKGQLSAMVYGREVLATCPKMEIRPPGQRNRALCKLLLNGTDVNLAMVRAGFAWHSKPFVKTQPAPDRVSYAQAELDARAGVRGLWIDPNPLPPWEFRDGKGRSSGRPLSARKQDSSTGIQGQLELTK